MRNDCKIAGLNPSDTERKGKIIETEASTILFYPGLKSFDWLNIFEPPIKMLKMKIAKFYAENYVFRFRPKLRQNRYFYFR